MCCIVIYTRIHDDMCSDELSLREVGIRKNNSVFPYFCITAFPHFRITAWKNYRFMGSLIKTLSTSHNQKANRGRESVCKHEQSTLNSPFGGLTESSLPILKDEHSKQPKRQFSLSHLENIFSGFLLQFCIYISCQIQIQWNC